jgi:2-phospho-L-lactate guanylyltransferase
VGSWLGSVAVLVPVKAFADAKLRLAPALDPAARASLARRMAEGVIRSAGALPVAVVCDDREVANWARGLGALVVWTPGVGLNRAVQEGVAHLAGAGVRSVVVAASDLPLATDLAPLADRDGFTLVPDRRCDGTNVIAVPTAVDFAFSYGPGSFARHRAAAEATGSPVRVLEHPQLAWDVDEPSDLAAVHPYATH